MFVCGIDENGLGPFLGPLVITAYESETAYKPDHMKFTNLKGADEIIRDSKAIFSRREKNYALIEDFFFERLCKVRKLDSSLNLSLAKLFLESAFSFKIKKICPIGPESICFSDSVKIPAWSEYKISAEEKSKENTCSAPKENFYFAIVCPKLLRATVRTLGSKFSADAYFMSILALRSQAQSVICGKAGFKKTYTSEIIKASESINIKLDKITTLKESTEESSYIISLQNNGKDEIKQILFVKDADVKFHQVAVASVLGKYLRELCMLSLTKKIYPDSVFPISGYGEKNKLKGISEKILKVFEEFAGEDFDFQEIRSECIERNY